MLQAHDATITKLSWAHPEFGHVLVSSSFDRVVKIWEHILPEPDLVAPSGAPSSTQRWVERASLVDARGSVRGVEFGPHQLGLKLVSGSLTHCNQN
jgi:nucleoporin SEH1